MTTGNRTDLARDLARAGDYLAAIFKALMFWRRPDPVTSPERLAEFVETRSKFVAQTTLYGYLKTRAGAKYVLLFDDDVFVESMNISKWEIYFACLADLTVHAVARVGAGSSASDEELAALAVWCHDRATAETRPEEMRPGSLEKARSRFADRVKAVAWRQAESGDSAFGNSPNALVKWAPVAPELKQYDTEIVANSLRFKWRGIREELGKCLDGPAVLAAWRGREKDDSPGTVTAG